MGGGEERRPFGWSSPPLPRGRGHGGQQLEREKAKMEREQGHWDKDEARGQSGKDGAWAQDARRAMRAGDTSTARERMTGVGVNRRR